MDEIFSNLIFGTTCSQHTKWWAFLMFFFVKWIRNQNSWCFSGWDGEHGAFLLRFCEGLWVKGIFLMFGCWKLQRHSPNVYLYYLHLEPKWPIILESLPHRMEGQPLQKIWVYTKLTHFSGVFWRPWSFAKFLWVESIHLVEAYMLFSGSPPMNQRVDPV